MTDIPKLPSQTLNKLRGMQAQKAQIDAQMKIIMETFMEVSGLQGNYNLDLDTGELAVAAAPVSMNGRVRGKSVKEALKEEVHEPGA